MSIKTRISREVMDRSGPIEIRLQWMAWGYVGTKYEGIRAPHFFFSYWTYAPITWKFPKNGPKSSKRVTYVQFWYFFWKNYMSYTISMNYGPRMFYRVRDICIFAVFLEVWEKPWISGTKRPRERILSDRVTCEWKYVGAKNQEDQTLSFWDIDWEGDGRIGTFFVRLFILNKSVQGLRSTVFAIRRYIKNIEHNDSIPQILYIKYDGIKIIKYTY